MKFLAALVLAISLYWADAADTVTYTCRTSTADNKGTISIRFNLDAVPTAIYAVGKSTSCSTGLTAGANIFVIAATSDSSAQYNYNAVIDTTAGTTAVDCGVATTDSAPKTSTVTFFVQKSTNNKIITSSDVGYSISCDWSNDVTTTKEITATKVTSNDVAATPGTKSDIDAKIEIYSAATVAGTQTQKSTVTLSETCSIRVTLNDIKNKLITKAKITGVKASSVVGFATADTVDLKDNSGCGIAASGVFITTNKFTAEATYNAANPTEYQYTSANFPCFRFVGSNDLYFKAQLAGCLETNSASCDVTCTKRKKRDVSSDSADKTAEISAFIKVVAEGLARTDKSEDSLEKRAGPTIATCLTHVSFLSIIAVMAILLLVSLGATIFFGSKLMRRSVSSPESGYPNMAYKS